MQSHSEHESAREHIAERLRERIYATIALMAVLVTIDPSHTTPGKAAILVAGTIVGLWGASLIASRMATRMVYPEDASHNESLKLLLRAHSPMLIALITPLLLIGMAAIGILSLAVAVNISIISSTLLLAVWSIMSVRALKGGKSPVILILCLQIGIIAGIISLKVAVGH